MLLELQNWNGAVGPVTIDADGRIKSQVAIKTIKDGKPVVVD